jgi:hypothetical protein
MIGRGFKSVGWVAGVGAAALGCYMLSLQVATERADLARVERQIISTKQQIRSLQTELGTRGRLTQLEQWNEDVLALAAPASGQFLQDEFTLARLETRDSTVGDSAQVRMASLETEEGSTATPGPPAKPTPAIVAPGAQAPAARPELVHRASFTPPPSRDASAPIAADRSDRGPASAQNPASAKPAKGKATTPTRSAPAAIADSASARSEAGKPTARADGDRISGGRAGARTVIARADAAPSAPARAATARGTERGSTGRQADSATAARSTVARAASDRPASGRVGTADGNTGKK